MKSFSSRHTSLFLQLLLAVIVDKYSLIHRVLFYSPTHPQLIHIFYFFYPQYFISFPQFYPQIFLKF